MTPAPIKPLIALDYLDKIDVRVGTVLTVEDVAHSDKLVRLRVDFGDHTRSILAGMKKERQNPKAEIEEKQAFQTPGGVMDAAVEQRAAEDVTGRRRAASLSRLRVACSLVIYNDDTDMSRQCIQRPTEPRPQGSGGRHRLYLGVGPRSFNQTWS